MLFTVIAQPSHAFDIIVGSSIELKKVTKFELRTVFAGRMRSWPNGVPIRVVVFDDNQNHLDFCQEMIGLTSLQFRRIWNRVIYSGIGESPFYVESEEEMLEKVRDLPGAIGYVTNYSQEEGIYVLPIE